MSTPDPERRVSIWSVPEQWRRLYFAIFSVQAVAFLGLAVWYEIAVATRDSWMEALFAVGANAGPVIAVAAAESVILTEVYFVVIFGGIVERYQNRLKQREAEGEARAYEKWESWNRRRLDAEAAGEPFDEPPPSLARNGRGLTPDE